MSKKIKQTDKKQEATKAYGKKQIIDFLEQEQEPKIANTRVDILPFTRRDNKLYYGLVLTIDKDGEKKWNLFGDTIKQGKTVRETISEAVRFTLGDQCYFHFSDLMHPVLVAEYLINLRGAANLDSGEHAISLNYIVDIDGVINQNQDHYLDFQWFPIDKEPLFQEIGYGQWPIVKELISHLKKQETQNE